ncbi:MAG: hypothetical protein WAT17_03815 [Candidatus Saccharimonadales bacterium]|jgi:hypothetical protein
MSRLRLFAQHDAKKVFKHACARYDLVYFGNVSQHTDEHQMVRGFTLSPSHVDRHYCVGTVGGVDVILLERMDTVSFPDKPSRSFIWTILQIDLKRRLPTHILLNSHRYDDILYAHLFAKFHELRQFSPQHLIGHDAKFADTFRIYALPQHADDVMTMLRTDTTSVLAHHFGAFDYEAYGEQLIIYAPTSSPGDNTIEQMFKAGIWLAQQLDPSLIQTIGTQTDDNTPRAF